MIKIFFDSALTQAFRISCIMLILKIFEADD